MSHGLIEGQDTMFTVVKKPWHGLGITIQNSPTIEEGIRLAGLDWNVLEKPIFHEIPMTDPFTNEIKNVNQLIKNNKVLINGKTGEPLSIMRDEYNPLQNIEAFNFFNPFLESGEANLDTAGSLFGGKKIFVVAKINRPDSVIVPQSDDRVEKYLTITNSHDGSLAVRVSLTPIRIVCANTLAMAHNSGRSDFIRIRHSKGMKETLSMVQETINLVNARFEATAEQYRELAKRDINQNDLKNFIQQVFSLNIEKEFEEEKKRRESKVIEKVTELFETGKGNDLKGVKGTRWAAYNSVTEYLTHHKGRTQENRFNSVNYSIGATQSEKALKLLIS